jgi:hypothetical protein
VGVIRHLKLAQPRAFPDALQALRRELDLYVYVDDGEGKDTRGARVKDGAGVKVKRMLRSEWEKTLPQFVEAPKPKDE